MVLRERCSHLINNQPFFDDHYWVTRNDKVDKKKARTASVMVDQIKKTTKSKKRVKNLKPKTRRQARRRNGVIKVAQVDDSEIS